MKRVSVNGGQIAEAAQIADGFGQSGQDLGMGTDAVVSCSRPGRTPEVQIGQPSAAVITCTLPPWLACLPDHHRSTPGVGPGVETRSVSISTPSMLT